MSYSGRSRFRIRGRSERTSRRSISLFARRLGERDFRTDRYTANFQVEKRYSLDFIVYFSYYFERISIFDLPCSAPSPDCEGLTLKRFSATRSRSGSAESGRVSCAISATTNSIRRAGNQTFGSFYRCSICAGRQRAVRQVLHRALALTIRSTDFATRYFRCRRDWGSPLPLAAGIRCRSPSGFWRRRA